MDREIIHVDIASFAVAVERLANPRLCRRPVVVAPVGASRAVVTAVSAEAWQAGIRQGMALANAMRYCRDVAVVPPNEPLYSRASCAVCRLLQAYSPVMEPSGYGHAYLDITGTSRLFGPPRDIAWRLQKEIRNRLRLDASVGVASNKMVSRIASVVTKPAGLHDVPGGSEPGFLAPLPAPMLPGVGPKAREQFDELNIRWISDIAAMQLQHLKLAFGSFGLLLYQRAFGIDHSPVRPVGGVPAVVREKMLPEDTNDYEMLRGIVFGLCVEACEQLRATCCRSARVELTLRYSDYREDSGGEKLMPPLQSETALQARVERLLGKVMKRRTRVRRVILKLTELRRGCVQLELFPDTEVTRRARLEASLDHLRRRFGTSAIETGTGYGVPEKSGRRLQWPNSISGTP